MQNNILKFPSSWIIKNIIYTKSSLLTTLSYTDIPQTSVLLKLVRLKDQSTINYFKKKHKKCERTIIFCEPPNYGRMQFHYFHLIEHIIEALLCEMNLNYEVKTENLVLFGDGILDQTNNWKGPNNINEALIKALWPKANIIIGQTNNIILSRHTIITDRALSWTNEDNQRLNKFLGYLSNIQGIEYVQNRFQLAVKRILKRIPKSKYITYIQRNCSRKLHKSSEKKLIKTLSQKYGKFFRSVDLSKLSFKEQVKIFAESKTIIGVHGNGLSHIIYMKPNTNVIELFRSDVHHLDYRILSDILGINHYTLFDDDKLISSSYYADQLGSFGHDRTFKNVRKINVNTITNILSS